MAFKEFCDGHGSAALLLHTQAHRLCGLQDHECCKRIYDVAMHILHPLDLVCALLRFGDNSTACHHIVSLVIFGEALDDHVRTMVERTEDEGSGKRCVDDM